MSRRVWPGTLQAPLPLGRLRSPLRRLGHDDHRTSAVLPPMRDTPTAEGGSIGGSTPRGLGLATAATSRQRFMVYLFLK
jgi:hypothetical protein